MSVYSHVLPCRLVVLTFVLADAFFDSQVCPSKYARVLYSATRTITVAPAVLLTHILLSENTELFCLKDNNYSRVTREVSGHSGQTPPA